jgi:broad specificity phosphatase PhoE
MRTRHPIFPFFAAALVAVLLAAPVPAAADGLGALAQTGRVLMLRHANAPGYGDPPGFRLGDCRTQRNLDEKGRAQARATGDRLRALGIHKARVYSSQWCRALETARLLGVGEVQELPGLNSFFEGHVERDSTLAALRDFLAQQPVDGPPLILVTHQVVINSFAEEVPASGGGSIFALDEKGKGGLRWITATQPVR